MLFPGQTSAPALGLVPVESWLIVGVLYLILAAVVPGRPPLIRCSASAGTCGTRSCQPR